MDELFGSGDMSNVEDIGKAAMQAKELGSEEVEDLNYTSKA
jgi:hypothetical protein